MSDWVTAFAPASVGNVGVGFDVLGLALAGVGDRVAVRRIDGDALRIAEVRGLDGELHPYLSTNAGENTASIAAQSFWNAYGDGGTLELKVLKGVPLQSGMGSSAASAVAAVVAANGLLDAPRPLEELLPHALAGEQFASNALHADNVAPSLFGGLVLCPQALLPAVVPLQVPADVSVVLLHPDLQVHTARARQSLRKSVPVASWVEQQGRLAAFIVACANNDQALLARAFADVIVEEQRAQNVACFDAVKAAAEKAGVLGCSLSGSGPSLFALCAADAANNVASAMEQACRSGGIGCQSWVSPMTAPGARLED